MGIRSDKKPAPADFNEALTDSRLGPESGAECFGDEIKNIGELLNNAILAATSKLPDLDPALAAEYRGYIQTLLDIYAEYADRFDELEELTGARTSRFIYATGDSTLHRGYRCPSRMIDLLHEDCLRGHPIRKPRAEWAKYLRYSMDSQDRILKVEFCFGQYGQEPEYLVYDNNKIYGITLDSRLSLEEYDDAGRLLKYITVLPDRDSGQSYHRIDYAEKLTYDESGRIRTVVLASGKPDLKLFQQHEYTVIYDAENQIYGFEEDGNIKEALKPDVRQRKLQRKRQKPANLVDSFNRLLARHQFPKTLDLDDAINAFEELSKITIDSESDDLLCESGHYDFTGETLYWVSLTRQYDTPEPDNSEYMQLHLNILFKPDDIPAAYDILKWSDGDIEAFFTTIRSSDLATFIRQNHIQPIRFSVGLDET